MTLNSKLWRGQWETASLSFPKINGNSQVINESVESHDCPYIEGKWHLKENINKHCKHLPDETENNLFLSENFEVENPILEKTSKIFFSSTKQPPPQ